LHQIAKLQISRFIAGLYSAKYFHLGVAVVQLVKALRNNRKVDCLTPDGAIGILH
jgi:hypothetical protein